MSPVVAAFIGVLEALLEKEGPALIDAVKSWIDAKSASTERVEDVLPVSSASEAAAKALGA